MGHLIMTRFTLWTNRRFCLEGLLSRLVIVVLEILDTYDIWSPDPMFFSVAAICVQPAHKLRKDEVVTRKVLNPGMCLMSKSHEKVWNTDLYHIFKPYSTLTGQRHGSASNLELENSKQLHIKWNSCFGSRLVLFSISNGFVWKWDDFRMPRSSYNLLTLGNEIRSSESAIMFLQSRNLLHKSSTCSKCSCVNDTVRREPGTNYYYFPCLWCHNLHSKCPVFIRFGGGDTVPRNVPLFKKLLLWDFGLIFQLPRVP